MKFIAGATLVTIAVPLIMGCSSAGGKYVPSKVGEVRQPTENQGISALLRPSTDRARIGDPIVCNLVLRNLSQEPVWIPREPEYQIHIIHPNGRRDNSLEELGRPRHYDASNAVLLKPGQQISTQLEVKTYYFDQGGITEIFAVVQCGRNTNAQLEPFWSGRAISNSYGIMIDAPWGYSVGRQIFGQVSTARKQRTI
jgi:hypothetical protein